MESVGLCMKEQYKRLFNIIAVISLLIIQTVIFSVMWYGYFSKVDSAVFSAFKNRGNWAVIGIYMLIMFFFANTLGGYQVG